MPVNLFAKAHGYYVRRTARLLFKRPLTIKTDTPLISFTFDDFPRSALFTGGAILKGFGLTATYYAAFGLMGKRAPVGDIFLPEDLKTLVEKGHELGCHTFDHCHSANTKPADFEGSIIKNQQALRELLPETSFKTLSYPISDPRPGTKQKTARHFLCCRGGGQTFNSGTADLNYLSAYFLEKSRNHSTAVRDVIDQNKRAKGWLILATHDICEQPSPFGCTPEFFKDIVQYAVNSGARILPVMQALDALTQTAANRN